jgi:hypothetical protein
LKLRCPRDALYQLPLGQSGVERGAKDRIQGFDFEGNLPVETGAL